jgi:putative addiction module killer protein
VFDIRQTETFKKWRSKLKDDQARAFIAVRLNRLMHGHIGDAASVGDGVSELRIHYGPGYRIYFRRHGSVIVVLLCGGDKSTQAKHIAKAKALAKNWSE